LGGRANTYTGKTTINGGVAARVIGNLGAGPCSNFRGGVWNNRRR